MGEAAARLVQGEVSRLLRLQPYVRIIMACAPSQDDYYTALVRLARATPELWARVVVFHMDDYVGLNGRHPQSFRHYLKIHFLDHVAVAEFNPIRGEATNAEAETARYSALLTAAPIDIISMGIGENGHIAFNDPPVADFNDRQLIKVVELDPVCRQQQVNDGCFPTLADVPRHAFSLTLPVFASAGLLCCIVPTIRKANAVRDTFTAPVGPACPSTLLRTHSRAELFVDEAAASEIPAGLRQSLTDSAP
jgi:glucosamine-6-phosphate deaminase